MVTSTLLGREVDGAAVWGPSRHTLAVVQDGANLAPIAAVGVHHPNVRVFHRSLAVGEATASSAKDDTLPVGRPQRFVLVVFRCRQAADAVVCNFHSENVVIEKLILIRLAIRNEQNLLAVR